MHQIDLYEFLLDTFTEMATLHATAAAIAEQALTTLVKYEETISLAGLHQEYSYSNQPKVNLGTYTVEWKGQHCHLGPTVLFKLIQRLVRRPGRYFTYDILMETVWQRRCSNTTIRSTVKRLRRALRDAGMHELATAIRGQAECYGLFLDDIVRT